MVVLVLNGEKSGVICVREMRRHRVHTTGTHLKKDEGADTLRRKHLGYQRGKTGILEIVDS